MIQWSNRLGLLFRGQRCRNPVWRGACFSDTTGWVRRTGEFLTKQKKLSVCTVPLNNSPPSPVCTVPPNNSPPSIGGIQTSGWAVEGERSEAADRSTPDQTGFRQIWRRSRRPNRWLDWMMHWLKVFHYITRCFHTEWPYSLDFRIKGHRGDRGLQVSFSTGADDLRIWWEFLRKISVIRTREMDFK